MEEIAAPEEVTFAELYEKLTIDEDLILDELPSEQLNKLRKGLSSYKNKQNRKLKDNDLPFEERKIEYEILNTDKTKGTIKVRVFFAQLTSIKAKIIPADGGLK